MHMHMYLCMYMYIHVRTKNYIFLFHCSPCAMNTYIGHQWDTVYMHVYIMCNKVGLCLCGWEGEEAHPSSSYRSTLPLTYTDAYAAITPPLQAPQGVTGLACLHHIGESRQMGRDFGILNTSSVLDNHVSWLL